MVVFRRPGASQGQRLGAKRVFDKNSKQQTRGGRDRSSSRPTLSLDDPERCGPSGCVLSLAGLSTQCSASLTSIVPPIPVPCHCNPLLKGHITFPKAPCRLSTLIAQVKVLPSVGESAMAAQAVCNATRAQFPALRRPPTAGCRTAARAAAAPPPARRPLGGSSSVLRGARLPAHRTLQPAAGRRHVAAQASYRNSGPDIPDRVVASLPYLVRAGLAAGPASWPHACQHSHACSHYRLLATCSALCGSGVQLAGGLAACC